MTSIRNYKVNRLLWESLEATFLAHGKRLVKEMATTLQVNEKELVKRVFPTKDAFRISLQDTESALCLALVEQGEIARRCRLPVVTGIAFCAEHACKRSTCTETETVPTPIRKVQDRNDLPPLWLLDTDLIDSGGTIRGTWDEETNRLFLIDD